MAAALCTDLAVQREHNLLVNKLHNEIEGEKTEEMRQLLRPTLEKNLNTFDVRTILNALTDKGIIHVGKYSYLKQVLADIHLQRLLVTVEETENNIETLLGSNTAEETVHGESQENGEGSTCKRKRTDTSEPSFERYADLVFKLELHKIKMDIREQQHRIEMEKREQQHRIEMEKREQQHRIEIDKREQQHRIEMDKQATETALEIARKQLTDEISQNTRKRKRLFSGLRELKAEVVGPIRTGSILLTVRFYSLEDLTYFWSKYEDGTVTATLSDILLSDKILEISREHHVEFFITCYISEDAYIEACRKLNSEDEVPSTVGAVARMNITDDTQEKEAVQEGPPHEQVESKTNRGDDVPADTVDSMARKSITDGQEAVVKGPSHEQMESKSKDFIVLQEEGDFDTSGGDLVEEAETGSPMEVDLMQESLVRAWASVQRSITGPSHISEQAPMNVGDTEKIEEMRQQLKNEPRDFSRIEEASTERTRTGELELMYSDAFLDLGTEMENELRELVQFVEEASKKLHYLAEEIDEYCEICNRGKIAGSAAALLGFPLIAGSSFVTFGALSGISFAGGLLSGLGGITAAGSRLAEHFITKSKCRAAQEAVNAVKEKAEAYIKSLENLKKMVPSSGLFSAVRDTGLSASNAATAVGIPALGGIRLAAGITDSAAATVFRGLGSELRVLHIGGLLVPYDVSTLASSSVKEYRKTGSEEANKIRKLAREMFRLALEGNEFLNPEDTGLLNLIS